MERILSRARLFAIDNCNDCKETKEILIKGYVAGAKEQRDKDIEYACILLKNVLDESVLKSLADSMRHGY